MDTTLRLATATIIALIVGGASTYAWQELARRASEQFAQQAEAVSYAARSELARDLQVQAHALHDVARYWNTYGHLGADQWNDDAQVEINHFEGIEVLLWHDQDRGIRYATTPADFSLRRRPSDQQWMRYSRLLEGLDPERGDSVVGPLADGDGEYSFREQIMVDGPVINGRLVALVDADNLLRELLRDSSPGYSIAVYWGEALLYQRDEPASEIPEAWRREGLIRLPSGPLWRVVHRPTARLVAAQTEPALPGLLASGWAIAILLGLLVYQNGRVRQRAQAAEAAERRVAAMNAELEALVEQRTRELAERTGDLETISESVVHDLRNPLNVVAVNTQLLRHQLDAGPDPGSSDHASLLERIEQAKEQMAAILDRMHAFSQVSFAPFSREAIDMGALAAEVFAEVAAGEPPPPIELRLGELPTCNADATMVRILLLNLLGNACKYSRDRDQRYVEIDASPSAEGTVYSVRDNGSGFDIDDAEKLFDPFVRSAPCEQIEGRGVGLAVVARIVRRHGGRIWAEGRPGVGAEFRFHLNEGNARSTGQRRDAA